MPSSLTRVRSHAFGVLPLLPASVSGTITKLTRYEAFLGSIGSASLFPQAGSSSLLGVNDVPDLPRTSPYQLKPPIPTDGWLTFLHPPFADNVNLVVQDY